ncbi:MULTISPECIES: metalloregulator ArsR/SmtB family transcription factor [unclassified Dehalobacter]|jgi:Predicted transcriptional regulators|uniref:ArsR/SmtB family transcription factor n=1 Tax=unclassified Dehalobacter TaxID=2635733 RepID=UPI00028B958D|nr:MULTISPECIES: metalloregulator ArsR/SmtB family transcription factor [unclassified Dehalobacter]AFV01192.1 transcriptional regulator, ArsR family [Dehalobacter sp. DCA]AFV04234.1 transcriptional regulator, ArsR family [Dehalobacter sp. CF]
MFESRFKALGEPTRLNIIKLLSFKDLCVCELEEIMQISQPRISQHLKVLKQSGLVKERKEGQRRVCSLNTALLNNTMEEFMDYIAKPLQEIPELNEAYERLVDLDGESCTRKLKQ